MKFEFSLAAPLYTEDGSVIFMPSKTEEKTKKRAAALRDNLKRRKDKVKQDKSTGQSERKSNKSYKT